MRGYAFTPALNLRALPALTSTHREERYRRQGPVMALRGRHSIWGLAFTPSLNLRALPALTAMHREERSRR